MSNRFFPGPLSSGMAQSGDDWQDTPSGVVPSTRDWCLSLDRPHLWLVHSKPCRRNAANDGSDRRRVNDLVASRY